MALRSSVHHTVARREHAADNDIVKWLYEESDFDLELSDEEQTVIVKNGFSQCEEDTDTNEDESEGEDNVQPATGDWHRYSGSDGDLTRFPYDVKQWGFSLSQSAISKSELKYFQLFFIDDLLNKIMSAMNQYAAEKIQKATPLPKFLCGICWLM